MSKRINRQSGTIPAYRRAIENQRTHLKDESSQPGALKQVINETARLLVRGVQFVGRYIGSYLQPNHSNNIERKPQDRRKDDYTSAQQATFVARKNLEQADSATFSSKAETQEKSEPIAILAKNIFPLLPENKKLNAFEEITVLIAGNDSLLKDFISTAFDEKSESTYLELAKEIFDENLKEKWPLLAVALVYSQSNGKNKIPDLEALHKKINSLLENSWSTLNKDELIQIYELMNDYSYHPHGVFVTDATNGLQSDTDDLIRKVYEETASLPTMPYEQFLDKVHEKLKEQHTGKYELEKRLEKNLNLSSLEYHVYRAYREITGKKNISVSLEDLKKKLGEEQHALKNINPTQITKAITIFNIRFNSLIQLSKENKDVSNIIVTYPDFEKLGFIGPELPDVEVLAEEITRIYPDNEKERFIEPFNVFRNGSIRIKITSEANQDNNSTIELTVKVSDINTILNGLGINTATANLEAENKKIIKMTSQALELLGFKGGKLPKDKSILVAVKSTLAAKHRPADQEDAYTHVIIRRRIPVHVEYEDGTLGEHDLTVAEYKRIYNELHGEN